MKTTRLFISDAGRGDFKEVAVEQEGHETKFIRYAQANLDNLDRFTKAFWKWNGYVGHLIIHDQDLAEIYELDLN